MESATIHILRRKKYYDVNELVDICPQIFNGCKNGFEFVHMANIKYEKYIFVRKNDRGKWMRTYEAYGDEYRIFILKDFFDDEYLGRIRIFIHMIERNDTEIIFMNERHEKELLKKDLEIIALKKDLEMANYKRKKRSSRK